MLSLQTLKDAMAFFQSPASLRQPAFNVINRVQDYTPAQQVYGTALALLVMSEEIGVPINDILTKTERMVRTAEGPFTNHVQAIRAYAREELRGKT